MQKIIPFLWFNDNAEEAINFYTLIFKNSKITHVTRHGEAASGSKNTLVVGTFELDGVQFMALNGGPIPPPSNVVSFVVDCADQDEVDHYWEKLSEGGEKLQGGWLRDRFGFAWQIVPSVLAELMSDPDPEKAKRVTRAMMNMTKLDIKTLKDVHAGG